MKIFLIGESNGAIYAYRFLIAHPDLAKAAVFISGSLESKILSQIKERASQIQTKILVVHGTDDQTFPFSTAEKTAQQLQELGLKVEFKGVNGMQHGADAFCEDEIMAWIEGQL